MSWLVSFARANWRCKERELSENNKIKKSLPTVGFEPGTSRLPSERATTELRRLMSTEWIKVHLVFTCAIFRNLLVARVRCSKIICRLFCHLIFVSFCCLPIKKSADSKEFTKCNSRKIMLLHLPSATGKFLKNSTGKNQVNFYPLGWHQPSYLSGSALA